jgi:3-phytase
MKFKQYQRIVTIGITCLAMITSVACQINETPASENFTGDLEKISFKLIDLSEKIEAAQLINSHPLTTSGPLADANIIIANRSGLSVLNKSGYTLRQLKGYFKTIDHRITPQALFIASVDGDLQQTIVTTIGLNTGDWAAPLVIPKPNFKTEDACLYQDVANNTFVFLVGEEGLGEQWLVAGGNTLLEKALLVRSLSFPPESKYCQVDDDTNTLYVNEENVGVWAYAAHDEAALLREPVAMLSPFGDIKKNASGMAVSNHQILVLDADSQQLHRYDFNQNGHQAVGITLPPLDLDTLNSPENLSVRPTKKGLEIMVHDKSGLHLGLIPTSKTADAGPQHHSDKMTALVKPLFETDLIPSLGDAADDPAIWIHPTQATKSLVIATDKQGGLAIYDLQGQEKQYLAVGRLNNVDIRTGFNLNGTLIDLAVASNRDHNSLHLFSIDRDTGVVAELGQQATSTNEIYGACMFKDKQNNFYAIVNDKDGRFEQYQLTAFDRQVTAKKVREFKVATQPEGCVAIDQIEQLFVGEENTALWTLNARADAAITMTKVIQIGEVVHADIEGVAYYKGAKNTYLVISSQGNDSYVILESSSPYRHRGTFKIAMNAPLGIDGASETDGLEVTSADLSGNNTGPWRLGMLVVQDGRKRMPEGKQNYKYVPWLAIAEALNLD